MSLTEIDLKRRRLKFLPVSLIENDLEEYLTWMHLPLEETEGKLINCLNARYACENDFLQAIFDANAGILEELKSESFQHVVTESDRIIFSFKDGDMSALGYFVGVIQEYRDGEMRPDLAVALFRAAADKSKKKKRSSQRNLPPAEQTSSRQTLSAYELDCYLAIIEFKMADGTLPSDFATLKENLRKDPTYAKKRNFLNQEVSYVIRRVCRGLSSCGISLDKIPFFVIVGKRSGLKPDNQLCCLEGELMGAKVCCDPFQYTIRKFEAFPKAPTPVGLDGKEPVTYATEQAATIFRRFIRFGFAVALEAMQNFLKQKSHPEYSVIKPMSGETLIIRGCDDSETPTVSDVLLYPSDYLEIVATPAARKLSARSLDVAQGDLFEGTLSCATIKKLRLPKSEDIESLWFHEVEDADFSDSYKVIIKVSSCAVHPQLVDHDRNVFALKEAYNNQRLRKKLSKVILVVFTLDVGSVTIMRDLRKQNYKTLYPNNFANSSLWNAVWRAVDEVFLPLASMKIVHYDLRPGSDVTSNILVKQTGDRLHLIPIDYESLIHFTGLSYLIGPVDGRFLSYDIASNAMGFLWWQCLSLVYVWEGGLAQNYLKDGIGITSELGKMSERAIHRKPRDKFESWLFMDEQVRVFLCGTSVISKAAHVDLLLRRVSQYFQIGKHGRTIPTHRTRAII